MKSHYRVVVIGGGVVGTSVLYHLAEIEHESSQNIGLNRTGGMPFAGTPES